MYVNAGCVTELMSAKWANEVCCSSKRVQREMPRNWRKQYPLGENLLPRSPTLS